jgi:carboxymethylenebutenolidase
MREKSVCDEFTEKDNEKFLQQQRLTRRDFNKHGAGVLTLAMLPAVANALDVVEQDVMVTTPDGEADCYFVHPSKGAHAAVIIWPDIVGIRPAFRMMGKRLAESGYSVLVVNPY